VNFEKLLVIDELFGQEKRYNKDFLYKYIYMYISTFIMSHPRSKKRSQWQYRGDGITILSEVSHFCIYYFPNFRDVCR